MPKTILVPTDFSKNAGNALEYAIEFAKREKAKLLLLHAVNQVFTYADVSIQNYDDKEELSKPEADKKLKSLQKKVIRSGIQSCEIICKEGEIINVILDTIEKQKPYMVIMGTKGARGIDEIILGSNTATVIEHAKCPVIAVPEKAHFSVIKQITYATNYHESDIDALKKIVQIGKLFHAHVTLLHVCDDAFTVEDEKENMKAFKRKVIKLLGYTKMEFKLVEGTNLLKILEDHIRLESPDLLAMSTHHRNLFDKLFGTSTTKKMAYHTKIPLLCFHYKEEPVIFV